MEAQVIQKMLLRDGVCGLDVGTNGVFGVQASGGGGGWRDLDTARGDRARGG